MLERSAIDEIKRIMLVAGNLAAKHHKGVLEIKTKSDDSPVTHVDELISDYIIDNLEKLGLNVPIISEEREIIEHGDTFFLIDPIDGTKSYIRGDDDYTVNIGLIEEGHPTYGFIYQPSLKLLHYTDHNKRLVVEQDGHVLSPSELRAREKEECIITISHRSASSSPTQAFIKKIEGAKVIFASSSVKLSMIADLSANIYPRFGLTMEWDIAAGHALISAAGGDVLCMDGTRMRYGKPGLRNPDFVACSKGFYDQIKKEIL